jgi:hypothetical protein
MSYIKTTDFASKDALLSGNPAKLVKGVEIDDEFNAIQVADADNVKGPGSATNNAVALYDGTTGKLIKDSAKTLPSGTIVGHTDTQTLTNKTISLTNNTVSGTLAEFNAACSDADFSPTTHNHTGVYEPADATILKSANIGVSVQAYDADTAKIDVAQNWTAAQRSGLITDNDLSFDLSGAGNNYACTPTAGGTLTFTNIAAQGGKSGFIKLVNGSNYAIAAHANTKILTTDLTKISATGTYVLWYLCDATNVYVGCSGNLA